MLSIEKIMLSLGNNFTNVDTFILGIAGGTASGKTSIAKKIVTDVGPEYVNFISSDRYYHNLSDQKPHLRGNFDHPDTINFKLLINHIQALINYQDIILPEYDFKTHTSSKGSIVLTHKPITIIEGHLIFTNDKLCQLINLACYVDTKESERFIRRLDRDINERGRTKESVIKQWRETVLPMDDQFVKPSQEKAHITLHSRYKEGYRKIVTLISSFLLIWEFYQLHHKNKNAISFVR